MTGWDWLGVAAGAGGFSTLPIAWFLRQRNLDRWLFHDLLRSREMVRPLDEPQHVFIAVCDHFEPEWGGAGQAEALDRVRYWTRTYPERFSRFADSRGRAPQHTMFFPQDEYRPEYIDELGKLTDQGLADVEIHLHHDHDSAESLTEKLETFRDALADDHGMLHRDQVTGQPVYGFIHGNWALCHSRSDGRWCGVPEELDVLRKTGCYADFTMPSAPSETQTRITNSIYYARNRPGFIKSHDWGQQAVVGVDPPDRSLLMIQGPLCLDWTDRKRGFLPRIENGDLHSGRKPSWRRFSLWHRCGVHVSGRPDWVFIKLHTHGCKPSNIDVLLGPDLEELHHGLQFHRQQSPGFQYHYVNAWEMAQLVHQAEAGLQTPDWDRLGLQNLSSAGHHEKYPVYDSRC